MKTKIFSLLFAIVAGIGSLSADTLERVCINGLYYNLNSTYHTAEVTYQSTSLVWRNGQYLPSYSQDFNITNAVIPATITFDASGSTNSNEWGFSGTYTVTEIGEHAFAYCSKLKSIEISDGVQSIDKYAFYQCANLTSISISNSIRYIGESAFSGCSSLIVPIYNEYVFAYMPRSYTGSYSIPNGIESIGSNAFSGCIGLTSIDLSNTVKYIGKYAFSSCSSLTSIGTPNAISSIGEGAFSNCSSLTSLTFTDSLVQIGTKAFNNCSNLTSISLGDSVRTINDRAFYNCSSLSSITLPETVSYIREYAFYGCANLSSINIPEGIEVSQFNNKNVFTGCTNLTSITINSSSILGYNYTQSTIPNISTLFGSQVTEYIIGDNIKKIGNSVFYNCKNLTSVVLPEGRHITGILEEDAYIIDENGYYKFLEAGDSYSFWTGISSIGNNAFQGCDNMNINFPVGIRSVGNYAFAGCSNVSSLKFHNKVTSIGTDAFYNCTGLTSVEILDSIAKIENDAFKGCTNIARVEISNLAAWSNIEFKNEYANPLYNAKHLYLNEEEIINLTIPETVTSLKKYTFINCENLQSVTIPYSVEKFDYSAFSGCNNIKSVSINSDAVSGRTYQSDLNMSHVFGPQVKEYVFGDSVTSIGSYAFYECDSIDSFVFGKNVTEIGSHAFYSAGKFSRRLDPLYEEFVLPSKLSSIGAYAFFCWFGLRSLTLPDSMQYIGQAAFGGCHNLAYLSIPASLNSISGEAFFGCTGLKSVTCWATTPPFMEGSYDNVNYHTVFTNVDCDKVPLFVPKESIEEYKTAYQWEEFTHIYPIEYADEINTSEVTATANEDNSVTVEWPIIEEAVIYTIEIKKNGELVCTLEFNEEGQLISKVFAMPSRNGNRQTKSATQTANGWQYTIDGLDSDTEYTYTITAKKADDTEVFTQTITFSTLSHEGIENIETNGDNTTKVLHNGQIYLLRGDKTYTLTGQEIIVP